MSLAATSTRVVAPTTLREYSSLELLPDEAAALQFLLPLSKDYPGIEQWYLNKVIPGIRNGTRLLVNIERQGDVVGLGIAKNEGDERKICTVRIAPEHAGRGIGPRVFDRLLLWLDDDMPHLTVNEAKLPLFERIFDYYGFGQTSAERGVYLPDSIELGFNDPEKVLIKPQGRSRRVINRESRLNASSSS
jgi:GNAT superfamily N-acetyltransferase